MFPIIQSSPASHNLRPELADNPQLEIRPVPATPLFFPSQHPPSRSSAASGEQEVADVIYRWIQSLPSDFSLVLSPRLSVKRRLCDEADDLPYEESDDGLSY